MVGLVSGSGDRRRANSGEGGRVVVLPHGSSSTVPQIEGFKPQKHHVSMEKASVGQVGAEEAGNQVGVVGVLRVRQRRQGKTNFRRTSCIRRAGNEGRFVGFLCTLQQHGLSMSSP